MWLPTVRSPITRWSAISWLVEALRHQTQHFQLAVGERVVGRRQGRRAVQLADHLERNGGVQVRLPHVDVVDGLSSSSA